MLYNFLNPPPPPRDIQLILTMLVAQNTTFLTLHRLRNEWIQRLLIRSQGMNENKDAAEMKKD